MQKQKFYRINQQVQAREIRLTDSSGKQIGIVLRDEALKRAQELGVDLVEIAPNAKPPVSRLIDFKKFLYQEAKRKREERKKTGISETKEIRMGPFTAAHDLSVRINRAKKFLKEGYRIKIVVKFSGRQMAHPVFGQKTLQSFLDSISEISKVEREPHFEGRLLWTFVSPMKVRGPVPPKQSEGGKSETEDKKINSKTL